MITFSKRRILVSRPVDCTIEEAWRLITDTEQWLVWGPSITGVRCDQRFIGPTSAGYVRTLLGLWVPFAITEYQHLRYWSWRIGRIQATGHKLAATNDGNCLVSFDMPWWAGPYAVICSIALSRISRLAGNKSVRRR